MEKALEKLEKDLKRVDRSTTPLLVIGLCIVLLMVVLIYNGYIQQLFANEFSIAELGVLIGVINVYFISLIIYASWKKKQVINGYGLKCQHCHKTPYPHLAKKAYQSDYCPFCQIKYNP